MALDSHTQHRFAAEDRQREQERQMSSPKDSYREQPDLKCCKTCKHYTYGGLGYQFCLCPRPARQAPQVSPTAICDCYEKE